ncbi:NAD(P)H-dependent oxidoreductase [bacterium]|nr:NAD(P)H-dependent oxidoreductase [bacterium]
METFIGNLSWRYATKLFDDSKKLSEDQKEKLFSSIQDAPTSFGLQPFKVFVIEDSERKAAIQKAGWNQPQYSTCSTILAFVTSSDVSKRITDYIQLASGGNADVAEKLKGYESMMRGFLEGKDEAWLHNWAGKQAYIALGFAMAACAELKIDSCPMEGFSPDELDKILQLPKNEKTAVLLTVGFRSSQEQPKGKVRFSKQSLFQK